ncbi:MAG TPA: hypothetical protein VEG38_06415 [Acidimicrobiia bacterium]|nr:hypothetical protein [Acidimicrobiia bacterium]
MHISRLARRRRQVGALVTSLCIAAGSLGTAALANSGSGATIAVEANVLVEAGMTPVSARQAAARLNSAIDSAAQTIARSAAGAVPGGRPVRTTAAATRAFANRVDAALTQYTVQTVGGLRGAGTATSNLVTGTMTGLNQVVRNIPAAIAVTAGAEVSVVSGADGTEVNAALNPVLGTAVRSSIRDSVRGIRPVLPLTRTTVRAVAAGVRQVVDASVVAVTAIVDATVDFIGAVLGVAGTTLAAVDAVADSAIAGLNPIVAAVDATLDNLSDVNLTAAVDASLQLH